MTKTITDVKIRPSTTNDMVRPKIQIDTPITKMAISEVAKMQAAMRGLTQREYMLVCIYKGTDTLGLQNLIKQELGEHADRIIKRFELL